MKRRSYWKAEDIRELFKPSICNCYLKIQIEYFIQGVNGQVYVVTQ